MRRFVPRGTLILIGGAEDKGDGILEIEEVNRDFEKEEIIKSLIPPPSCKNKKVEIITTASNVPDETSQTYRTAFERIGFHNVGFINIVNHKEASDPQNIRRIQNAYSIFFAGGDQFRLSTILGNTLFMNAVLDRYFDDPEFIIAATSAGAMSASVLMMYEGTQHEALLKGTVKISSGLGIIDRCLIDTHLMRRGRFGRLAQGVIMNPTCTGIGLGEDTALFITKGRIAECKGSGMVVIIDGRDIGHTNISYAENNTPLCCENLRVHILIDGAGFDLENKKFMAPKLDLELENKSRSRIPEKHTKAALTRKKKPRTARPNQIKKKPAYEKK